MNEKQIDRICPLCKSKLFSQEGDGLDPRNGVMVFCKTPKCIDSGGHGKNEEAAFNIFEMKCGIK